MSERLQKAHIIPKYMGGTRDPSNLQPLPIALHSFLHELIARDSLSPKDRLINHRAALAVRGQGDEQDKSLVDNLFKLLDGDIKVRQCTTLINS